MAFFRRLAFLVLLCPMEFAAFAQSNIPRTLDFPERQVLEPASAANGNIAQYEPDRAYAARISELWLTWAFGPEIARNGFMDRELASSWQSYFNTNRLALVEEMKLLRRIADGAEEKFPTEAWLRDMHDEVQRFVGDQLSLNEEAIRLGEARRSYCEAKQIPCMSSEHIGDLTSNVPVEVAAVEILSESYFDLETEGHQATIAAIDLNYGPQEEALAAAWAELKATEDDYTRDGRFYREAESDLKTASRRFWEEVEEPNRILDELKAGLEFEILHAKRVYGKHQGFEQTTAFTDGKSRIERQTSRIAQIDRRLAAFADQPASEQARESAAALQAERDRRANDISAVQNEIDALRDQYEKPPETPGTRKAREELETKGREARQRIQFATERLEQSVEKRNRLRDAYEASETRFAEALDRYRALAAGRAQSIAKIMGGAFFEAERVDKTAEIADLNDAIRDARAELKSLVWLKADRRKRMLAANARLQTATNDLAYSALYSALAQTGVEAGSQYFDMAKALKDGGLRAAAFSGLRDMVDNMINPKPTYDARYDPETRKIVVGEIKDGYLPSKDDPKSPEDTANTVSRMAASETIKYFAGIGIDYDTGMKPKSPQALDGLSTRIYNWFFESKKTNPLAGFENKTLQNGVPRAGLELGKQLGSGFVKSKAIASIKKVLAEFFEGDAHKEYHNKQWLLRDAVEYFRFYSKKAREKQAELDELVAKRDGMAQYRFDSRSGFTIKANTAFDVDANLSLEVFFVTNDEDRAPVASPYPGALSLSLNGVALDRRPNTNVFMLSEQGAEFLNVEADETLDVELGFR